VNEDLRDSEEWTTGEDALYVLSTSPVADEQKIFMLLQQIYVTDEERVTFLAEVNTTLGESPVEAILIGNSDPIINLLEQMLKDKD